VVEGVIRFGAEIEVEGLSVKVKGMADLRGRETIVPGDFSSAAFFMVASFLMKNSGIVIRDVGINATRTGLINVLRRMGAEITVEHVREVSGEPVADISCKGGNPLKAITIPPEEMPLLIDEFPILCIAATQAEGITEITGAEELRIKESDRIKAMATELKKRYARVSAWIDQSNNGSGWSNLNPTCLVRIRRTLEILVSLENSNSQLRVVAANRHISPDTRLR
jgi:3-phosphoshikimate 1-carboxyvinyltransferase